MTLSMARLDLRDPHPTKSYSSKQQLILYPSSMKVPLIWSYLQLEKPLEKMVLY